MIKIKQSEELHESGYRLMEISSDDEVINTAADVLYINFSNLFDGLNLDIEKDGTIRIWSYKYDLKPNKIYCCSSSVFTCEERGEQ